MNRDELEPNVLECVERIERAVELLYLEWYFYPKRDIRRFDFTYRIELDYLNEGKYPRIRLRAGSHPRKTFLIGRAEVALKACVFCKSKLCNTALIDLQRILSTDKFPFWFYKDSPGNVQYPYKPEYVMEKIVDICKKIKPGSLPLPLDIDDLSGFFIENYPNSEITYQRFESSFDLLDDINLESCLNQALIKILPESSTTSFSLTRLMGRYWTGDFTDKPYWFYFDLGWKNGKYEVRFLNIAGFPRKKSEKKLVPSSFPYISWPFK